MLRLVIQVAIVTLVVILGVIGLVLQVVIGILLVIPAVTDMVHRELIASLVVILVLIGTHKAVIVIPVVQECIPLALVCILLALEAIPLALACILGDLGLVVIREVQVVLTLGDSLIAFLPAWLIAIQWECNPTITGILLFMTIVFQWTVATLKVRPIVTQ